MSTKAVPALGFTQFCIEIPKGYAMVIRRSDGSTVVLRDHAAELVVAPILSFSSTFILNGVDIPYQCEILPRAVAGMTKGKFPRELSAEFQGKIGKELQVNAKRLIMEQAENRVITMEVEYDKSQFTCLILLTDGRV